MDTSHLTRYRDLSNWSESEWLEMDIYLYIAANFNRYCGKLLKRVGVKHLPSDATEIMASLFSDIAHKPLTAVHQRELAAAGERRNQVMLGSLKKIAETRVLEALIKEFPSHISVDAMMHPSHFVDASRYDGNDEVSGAFLQSQSTNLGRNEDAFYAAESVDDHVDYEHLTETPEEIDRAQKVEMIRGYLSATQYKHLRYVICDGLTLEEIAERTGCSATNVRIVLLHARKAMLNLVPVELRSAVESSLYRRQPSLAT